MQQSMIPGNSWVFPLWEFTYMGEQHMGSTDVMNESVTQ